MSGFPYWTSDIAAIWPPAKKVLFVSSVWRLSPMMVVRGMGEHDPWKFDAETQIFIGYAELYTRFVPYIYNSSLCRPDRMSYCEPALEYQDDPKVYALRRPL